MKLYRHPFTLIALLLGLLVGCTRHYYGVPEDDWHRMSEVERSEIIRIYQERRLHEERRRAAEAEMRAREMAVRHHHYPEYVYVRLSGGVFSYHGKRYRYHDHHLHLRQGQVVSIVLVSINTRTPQRIKLWVRYHEGRVMLGDGRRYLRSFDYHDSWKRGEHYRGIKLRGGVKIDDMDVTINTRPIKDKGSNRNGPDFDKNGKERNGELIDNDTRNIEQIRGPRNQSEKDWENKGRANQERAKQERAKQERAKQERAKQERAKQERAKQKRAKQERAKQERAKQERAKQERAKQERAKQERAKQERAKQERAKQERAKQERAKQERAKQERAKQERAKQERAKQERAKQDKAKQDKAKQDKAKQDKAKQDKAKQDKAKQEKAKQDKAKQEKGRKGDDKCVERGSNNRKNLPYCEE